MGTYSYAIWIAAPPDGVYDLYTDLDRVGEWQEGKPTITDRSGDRDRPGYTYTTRRGRSTTGSAVIVAERPMTHVVHLEGALGLHAEITSRFVREQEGTRMTIELDARWRSPLVGRVLEKAIFDPRTARRELAKLKEIAEREHRAASR